MQHKLAEAIGRMGATGFRVARAIARLKPGVRFRPCTVMKKRQDDAGIGWLPFDGLGQAVMVKSELDAIASGLDESRSTSHPHLHLAISAGVETYLSRGSRGIVSGGKEDRRHRRLPERERRMPQNGQVRGTRRRTIGTLALARR